VKTAKTGDLRTKNQQVTRKKMAQIRVFTQALEALDDKARFLDGDYCHWI
jgi:hypothetical protein